MASCRLFGVPSGEAALRILRNPTVSRIRPARIPSAIHRLEAIHGVDKFPRCSVILWPAGMVSPEDSKTLVAASGAKTDARLHANWPALSPGP